MVLGAMVSRLLSGHAVSPVLLIWKRGERVLNLLLLQNSVRPVTLSIPTSPVSYYGSVYYLLQAEAEVRQIANTAAVLDKG